MEIKPISDHKVRIYMMPQQFPCGPSSSCCGPIGQSEEELLALKEGLEKSLNIEVETINVADEKIMRDHLQILRLLRSFGQGILPIVTVGDEVISKGNPSVEEAVTLVKAKLETRKA